MASYRKHRTNKYNNWIKAVNAVRITQQCLAPFVYNEIKQFQQKCLTDICINNGLPSGTVCSSCCTENVVVCPTNRICNVGRGICRYHRNVSKQYLPAGCPNQICHNLWKDIKNAHRYCGPSYKNTDATQWCTNPWEVAKCFMPHDGYKDVTSPAETHLNGIISVIISFKNIQEHIFDNLGDKSNIFEKCRRKASDVTRSPSLECEDAELQQFFTDLQDLLSNLKLFAGNNDVLNAKKLLSQLQNDVLDFDDQQKLKNDPSMLPQEIKNMDKRAIKLYIKLLKEGKSTVRNIRLMIVGHSGVGKTTLAKRLFKEEVDKKNHQSTDGIDVYVERCKISLIDGTWLQSDGNYSKRLGNHVAPMLRNAIDSDDPLKSEFTKAESKNEKTHPETDVSRNLATNMSPHEISNENSFEKENDAQNELFHRAKTNLQEIIGTNDKGTNDGITDDHCDLSLWDFAGQSIYYATHQAFLSRRGIYLLVFDISKQISDKVEDDELCIDVTVEQRRQISEFILFWLNSIHEFCSCQGEKGPPVIFVGTFADKLEKERKQNAENRFLDVRSILPEEVEKCHITKRDFDVDNAPGNKNEDKNIDELRKFIVEVAKDQVHWNERIPLRWIALEDRLLQLKEERNVIQIKELHKEIERMDAPINDEEELDLFLTFYHKTGTILYFGDDDMKTDIVLRPQWLIDAFKSLITANIVYIQECKEKWLEFKSSAILTMDLINQIWTREENSIFWDHKDLILGFMKKLGFVAKPKKCTDEPTEAKDIFLVPCMFKNKVPEKITTLEDTEQCKITSKLCLTNAAKASMRYIPSTAFNKLLAACINHWELAKEDDKYMIFRGGAVLKLKDNHRLYIFLYEHVIQIWISRKQIDGLRPNRKLSLEVKNKILTILKENVRMQRKILSFVKCKWYNLYSNENMDHPLQEGVDDSEIQCFCRKPEHVVTYTELAEWWLPEDLDQEWPNVAAMTAQIKVASCTSGHVQRYLNSHEVYSMTKLCRGRCLILSNEHFHKQSDLSDRQGTEKDVERTEELFKLLYFKVIIHRDLTAEEIKKTLELEAKLSDHDQAECFVCVICSHGTEKGVCGTDGNTVSPEEIKTFFDASNCEYLQSKPKLFFIQACQGVTKDRSDVADGGSDSCTCFSKICRFFGKTDNTDTTDAKNKQKTVPAKTDILIAYATHPGYVSIRNIDYGSWFIQAVIYVFQKYAFTEDISDLLTRVNNLVANGRAKLEHGGLKNVMQASKSETSLRRKLFFFPGHVSNSDA